MVINPMAVVAAFRGLTTLRSSHFHRSARLYIYSPVTTIIIPQKTRARMDDRPVKKTKFTSSSELSILEEEVHDTIPVGNGLASLHRSITPPLPSRSQRGLSTITALQDPNKQERKQKQKEKEKETTSLPSPIQLTHIRDLPASSGNNIDTVRLRDILGDPMIRECWQFNYCIDVDYLMSQFDEDVRGLVQVKVVHGSWKREAPNRIRIDEACSRYPNVEPIVAYMPEPFGTHHSKMMVLLRHDDLAQVIIHTANMIPGDWANMCQAVWRSPLLPLQSTTTPRPQSSPGGGVYGTGTRFKRDLLAYLNAYGRQKTGSLVNQLARFDFRAVRAALIASVPSKKKLEIMDSQKETLWGWPAVRDILRHVPTRLHSKTSHIVAQISSVASLGQTDKWLKDIFFESLAQTSSPAPRPRYSIIFPTPDEIRRSLNGYSSGGSVHMKVQSPPQQKQLQYMLPYLRQWAGDRSTSAPAAAGIGEAIAKREAGRRRAAPHIKTYIRYTDAGMDSIDWAMVTSANLSTQAWGAAVNPQGEVRICSWEIGVVVWPGLFVDDDEVPETTTKTAKMVPCFKRDHPPEHDCMDDDDVVVGFRMPYDLPLTSYGPGDQPWCATASYTEPDWLGQTWEG